MSVLSQSEQSKAKQYEYRKAFRKQNSPPSLCQPIVSLQAEQDDIAKMEADLLPWRFPAVFVHNRLLQGTGDSLGTEDKAGG